MGVISMKLIGEGAFNHEDRQKAMRFAFRECGRGFRDGGLQEYGGDRRGHRQPEPGAGVKEAVHSRQFTVDSGQLCSAFARSSLLTIHCTFCP